MKINEKGTCQTQKQSKEGHDSEEHSLSGEHRGRDSSGHIMKVRLQEALTGWKVQRDLLGHKGKVKLQVALTLWGVQREGLVRT